VNVAVSKSWEEADGWRKVSVGLNWYDLVKLVSEKRVEGYHIETVIGPKSVAPELMQADIRIQDDSGTEMPIVEQYKVLQAQADILVLYQRVVDGYPAERAKAEIMKIRERVPILK
jgi:hypothetical protein